jgi:hydroxymethylpyrimidine pyrophosphatase-like HAD family hydrolase
MIPREMRMRIRALALDYDGTIAHHGAVAAETVEALATVRGSGRRLILVTGRSLEDLLPLIPDPSWFDVIVAENGAVLYDPDGRIVREVGEPPPSDFLLALHHHGIPADQCRVMVTMEAVYKDQVARIIRAQRLPSEVILNKDSAMMLPRGVDKGSGLRLGLDSLGLTPFDSAGIGDAENDVAFLGLCRVAAAVQNALPSLKAQVDLVMQASYGRGVVEFIQRYVIPDWLPVTKRLRVIAAGDCQP